MSEPDKAQTRMTEERNMRLFIAIKLSDEMKKALINCMHDLKKQGVEGKEAGRGGKLCSGAKSAYDACIYRRIR